MEPHHGPGKHEYLFSNSVLQSDAIISIPKYKTHRRTGVTMALKNHMGLPALKTPPPFHAGPHRKREVINTQMLLRERDCTPDTRPGGGESFHRRQGCITLASTGWVWSSRFIKTIQDTLTKACGRQRHFVANPARCQPYCFLFRQGRKHPRYDPENATFA